METFRVKAVPSEGTCTLVLFGEADLAVAPDIVELGALRSRRTGHLINVLDATFSRS